MKISLNLANSWMDRPDSLSKSSGSLNFSLHDNKKNYYQYTFLINVKQSNIWKYDMLYLNLYKWSASNPAIFCAPFCIFWWTADQSFSQHRFTRRLTPNRSLGNWVHPHNCDQRARGNHIGLMLMLILNIYVLGCFVILIWWFEVFLGGNSFFLKGL